jgi:MFS family permease
VFIHRPEQRKCSLAPRHARGSQLLPVYACDCSASLSGSSWLLHPAGWFPALSRNGWFRWNDTGTSFLSDRAGRKPLLLAISALAAIGAGVSSITTEFWILAIMSVLVSIRSGAAGTGGGFGPFYPAEQALVAESSTDRDRNAVFASLSLVGVLTAAAGSLLAGSPHILQTSP